MLIDPDLIDATAVPGLLPPRQARSRRVVAELVEAGLRLVRTRDFASISVVEICAEAGVTSGAFYKRFPGKELFVEFLQRVVVDEIRRNVHETLTAERWGALPLRVFLRKSVGGTVRWFRQYEGFVRASLRLAQERPETWSPMKETGARYAAAVEPIVMRIVGRPGSARVGEATRFAVQLMLGMLHSMVLIDPGPCRLHEDRTIEMLSRTMADVIEAAAGVGPPDAARSPRVAAAATRSRAPRAAGATLRSRAKPR